MSSDLEQLWIGLHDLDMQMDFQWTDHTPVTLTPWHPFEPNNFRNTQEDCVSMWGPVSNLCIFRWSADTEWSVLGVSVGHLHTWTNCSVQEGRWDDSPCNLTLPFICKKPGTKSEGKPQNQECKQVLHFSFFGLGSNIYWSWILFI